MKYITFLIESSARFCLNKDSGKGYFITMSGIRDQITDQTNHAVALLGGATAQSYSVVSLNTLSAALDVPDAGSGLAQLETTIKSIQSEVEYTSHAVDKSFVDSSLGQQSNRFASLTMNDELSDLPSGFVGMGIQNPELMSRFDEFSVENESDFDAQQLESPGAALSPEDSSEGLASDVNGFSFFDFIEQAIAQAEASQQDFGDTFDGSRQGEFREFLVNTGMELDSGVRGFLQENVAGVGRDLLSSAIDATGVDVLDPVADPLLSVDYYAKSAEVLNSLMDAVAQPIGSIALPQLGPLLADPREELSAYLG
ncbi:hypothetical protein [Limnobacter sp. 130]|uniref:hypothetical protein n=1 Tax=Limnobacter sp. 130 TaxID=2653147 RepID=UPI001356B941|nr:hypothetical protein [Limnobacter sp. 130]